MGRKALAEGRDDEEGRENMKEYIMREARILGFLLTTLISFMIAVRSPKLKLHLTNPLGRGISSLVAASQNLPIPTFSRL